MALTAGNPGLCEYYKKFLEAMHTSPQLRDRSVIVGLSQLGHDLPRPSAPPPTGRCRAFGKDHEYYSLKDQLAMADAAVAEMRAKYAPKPIPLIVMGHSVGAYIAQHVYARAPDQFLSVHLLFPTISHIGATPNGQRLSTLFLPAMALVATWLSALLALLPLALHRALIGVLTSQTQYNAALTTGFLRRRASVFNALSMARDEVLQITDLDPAFVDAVNHATYRNQTVRTYWGQKNSDPWAPSKWRMHAEAELGLEPLGLHPDFTRNPEAVFDRTLPPRSSTECAVSIPHSFCLGTSSDSRSPTYAQTTHIQWHGSAHFGPLTTRRLLLALNRGALVFP